MRARPLLAAAALLCAAAGAAWLLLPTATHHPADPSLDPASPTASATGAPAPAATPARPPAPAAPGVVPAGASAGREGPAAGATPPVAPRTLEERVEAARLDARQWLDARAAAKAANDRAAEDAARARWEVVRKDLLQAVRDDFGASVALLDALTQMTSEDEAFAIGRLLPFLFADGFEAHLVRTLAGPGPLRARRLALVALRGRGLVAADATERVAAADPEPVLRGEATDELGTHLTDPLVRPRTARIHATVTARLADADPGVRRAAVRALLAGRQGPASEEQEIAVRRISTDDPDASLRAMATALLARWTAPR